MPIEVILPKVDMDMETGIIAEWKVGEGDSVRQGDILFDLETNKSMMEVESPGSGIIRQLAPITGEPIAVGTSVAWIYAEDEGKAKSAASPSESDAPNAKSTPSATERATSSPVTLASPPEAAAPAIESTAILA